MERKPPANVEQPADEGAEVDPKTVRENAEPKRERRDQSKPDSPKPITES